MSAGTGAGSSATGAPIDVFVGTREICLPDVLQLQERARVEDVKVGVTVCEGAVHVYPLVPALEGRAAARAIVDLVARG